MTTSSREVERILQRTSNEKSGLIWDKDNLHSSIDTSGCEGAHPQDNDPDKMMQYAEMEASKKHRREEFEKCKKENAKERVHAWDNAKKACIAQTGLTEAQVREMLLPLFTCME